MENKPTVGQQKLIKKGYDILDCPLCEKKCYPTVKYKNGTVRYAPHVCGPPSMPHLASKKSFSINVDGDLIGY